MSGGRGGLPMLKEFKEFAVKGNMLDMAVGIIIGAAFGTVITSLVNDLLMPVISGIIGTPDFSNLFLVLRNPTGATFTSVKAARDAGAVVLAYGLFLNAIIAFLIVSFALFMMVKGINRLRRQEEAAPAAPEAPPAEVQLLSEIRDLLRRRGAAGRGLRAGVAAAPGLGGRCRWGPRGAVSVCATPQSSHSRRPFLVAPSPARIERLTS